MTSRFVAKDVIQCKAIVNDRVNADAIWDFMAISVNVAFHCPAASMERN